jgi:hypothetical protein
MAKNISFIPNNLETHIKLPTPIPAKLGVPEWYKNANSFIGGEMVIGENGANKDIKLCIPFLDTLTTGYLITLWADLVVQKDSNGIINFQWAETPAFIAPRNPKMAHTLPIPTGHGNSMFAWIVQWGIKTPPGYSTLYLHPLNRFDLPFTTTNGIVDTDNYSLGGEIPFFLKKDFEGIIPEGTPIIQVIPFKREDWVSKREELDESFLAKSLYEIRKKITGSYKKRFWHKKSYS